MREAQAVRSWLDKRGFTFVTGTKEETELTDGQILGQCKMYIAAMRIADEFGCDAIGIQYQQGLKDMAPASDLVEGLLNNVERPPVFDASGRELYAGKAAAALQRGRRMRGAGCSGHQPGMERDAT